MTSEIVMVSCRENSEKTAASLKDRIQPWVEGALGLFCLTQGLRLLLFGDSIAFLMGLALLTPVPACCYFGWRDYRKLGKAVTMMTPLRTELRQVAHPPAA